MTQKSVNREYQSNQFRHLSHSFTLWLDTLGYAPHTVKLNRWCMDEFFAFLELQDITQLKAFENNMLNSYLEHLNHRPNCIRKGSLSAAYINKQMTALRLFSKYLQQSGKATLPLKPELLKTNGTATFLTREEIIQLFKTASDLRNIYHQRDTAMLSVFYGCGLRASEGAALNLNDLLFERELIYVRKGKNYRERYVPMNPQVKSSLQEYITHQRTPLLNGKKSDALLISRNGTRWSKQGMYNRLQLLKYQTNNEALKQKSFGLHILRHSIATHLLQGGMKLEFISQFLGHKSLETTQKYTHLIKSDGF
ncbi:MAG: tyrosine-type recombinase/integrase [Marinilabiliaceae bacterium]|nr:tyrosine-type recombinase/integrase [Marinilabiliaceae bacterium]